MEQQDTPGDHGPPGVSGRSHRVPQDLLSAVELELVPVLQLQELLEEEEVRVLGGKKSLTGKLTWRNTSQGSSSLEQEHSLSGRQ